MLEMLLCSLVTLLPDYLYRRYVQGKRFGKEITFYSVWFELRWGITGCLVLTVLLITTVFYNHPSTTNVTLFFRTVPILPEAERTGRRGHVGYQRPGHERRADFPTRQFQTGGSGRIGAAQDCGDRRRNGSGAGGRGQSRRPAAGGEERPSADAWTSSRPSRNCIGAIPVTFPSAKSSVCRNVSADSSARSPPRPRSKQSAEERISTLLPAEKASAEAALAQAQVELDKTVIRAGVDGRVEQFTLRVGDVVNPMMRPAGILIPEGAGQRVLQAGFGQIEAQIMKVGMVAEVTCVSKPFTIIPMVVTNVQNYIAAGQFRGGEQLVDAQQVTQPGTLLVFLEPLYKGGLEGVTPGSSCIANAYSNNHDVIVAKDTGAFRAFALHAVDALALVHALILRLQALVIPFQTLVFGGH